MSNPMEKAQKLGQQLFEIQTNTISKLASMQQENMQRYFELNREFVEKLPGATDPQSIFNLQREMAQTMWQNYQSSTESTSELVRHAWEEVGEAYKGAFSDDEPGQS